MGVSGYFSKIIRLVKYYDLGPRPIDFNKLIYMMLEPQELEKLVPRDHKIGAKRHGDTGIVVAKKLGDFQFSTLRNDS